MNIKAVELLQVNKNMKFGEDPAQPKPIGVNEPPVIQPQTGLNGLQMQANNNIAFMGKTAVMSKIKGVGLASIMALMTLGAASCTEDRIEYIEKPPVNVTTIINIDYSQQNALLQKLLEMYEKMYEQNQITNDQLAQTNAFLMQMMALLTNIQNNQTTSQELMKQYYEQMYEFMMQNQTNQEIIIGLLQANGKTEEESREFLEKIFEEVQKGNLSVAEAMQQIMEALGDINSTLQDILAELKNISENITMLRESYNDGKKQTLDYLSMIYSQGQINQEYLDSINKNVGNMDETLNNINNNVGALREIAEDDTKYNELMEQLKKLEAGSIDYTKLEDMFKALGISITDAINMSKDELIAAIDDFELTYINTEKEQTEEIKNININLEKLVNYPGIDQSSIKEAIDKLTEAVNKGNFDVTAELKNISQQLYYIQQTLNKMYQEVGDLSSKVDAYYEIFLEKFDNALNYLVDIKNSMNELKQEQYISNQFLAQLEAQVKELTVKIDNIQGSTGNITLEELKKLWQEQDEASYQKYENLIKNLGIELNGEMTTIEELLKAINAKMDQQKDYSAQLDKIISMLDGIDLNSPDYSDKLDRIIELLENFKCNCDCNCGSGNNEGILGDLEDLLQ